MMLGTVRLRASKDMACGGKKVDTSTQRRQGKATRINRKCLVVPRVKCTLDQKEQN